MSAQALPTQAKIEELESIRGLAALLVVIYHIPLWNRGFDIGLIRNGYLMVELFFVLSGFVIYNAYSAKITNSNELLRFEFLRFGRLYPVHFLFIIVFVFIELAKYFAQLKLGISSPNTQPFRENNFIALFQQIFLIHAIGPTGNAITFNGPAWSISVEFYTYLAFGLVALRFTKFKNHIFTALFAISLLLLVTENTFGFDNLFHCYTGFFLGCMVAFAKEKTNFFLPSYASLFAFAFVIIFLVYKTGTTYDFLIFFLTAFLIFCLVTSERGTLKTILNIKPLTWLGAISYSVYMSHIAIIWAVNQVFRVLLKKPEIILDGRSTPVLSFWEASFGYICVVVVVLAVSTLVYNFIEKPIREKSRRFAFSKLNQLNRSFNN